MAMATRTTTLDTDLFLRLWEQEPMTPTLARIFHRRDAGRAERRMKVGPVWAVSQWGGRRTPPPYPQRLFRWGALAALAGGHGPDGTANRGWARRPATPVNRSGHGYALDIRTTTRRAVRATHAPTFRSRSRMVPTSARASSVPAKPTRRMCDTSTYAAAANRTRNWLATNAWQLVRSANNWSCCSLIRFSISPRAQYRSS